MRPTLAGTPIPKTYRGRVRKWLAEAEYRVSRCDEVMATRPLSPDETAWWVDFRAHCAAQVDRNRAELATL